MPYDTVSVNEGLGLNVIVCLYIQRFTAKLVALLIKKGVSII